ncbi:RHS repeat-associated core domain-containing protein [Actinokineospora bangkokensis]|uniref:Teneurin-like YD-shell domain-containing protein n=1 Tax=Actinokineospora bangkokensis TaxID=1193682 RepID=A0A1Q9LIK6_9PSEU|nr:RHS repeat-associated core domain-containing protein [Actinokineospora bangkokensis]OLR91853.1 hypothetical protein BJP25_23740 [Actinokineospora bangkokensis]
MAGLLLSTAVTALAAPDQSGWHGLGWNLPGTQAQRSVDGGTAPLRPLPAPQSVKQALTTPPAVAWPAAAAVEVDLAATARAAGPATLGRAAAKGAPGRVKLETLDRAASDRARVPGLLMTVTPVSGEVTGPLSLDVDYSAIAGSYGADYGRRLTLVGYPGCILTTPDKPQCRVATKLPATNSLDNHVRGQATLPTAVTTTGSGDAQRKQLAATPMVVAAVPEASGGGGNLAATSLSPAGSWSAGGSSGAFTYDYPITLPAPPFGKAPGLSLDYSSGSVDGATSATNNQASWVGDGWGLSVGGYIERTYKSCAADLGGNNGQTKTGDQCWATDNASLSLGSASGPLVKDAATGAWHPKNDDGSRVERLTGANNGARDGEHWRVTTTDGTQYYFGLNRLPGWVAGKPETQSTNTVPVFGNNAGEPCNAATFAASWCQQAYRWNLDYVVDTNGNQITYYYQPEVNHYGRNLNTTSAGTAYTRGSYLLRMEYGLNSGVGGGAYGQAPARVVFDTAERCLPSGSVTCDPAQLTPANAASWPDVPADQICNQGATCQGVAPVFFTRKRLTAITTQVASGSGWADRDRWNLTHSFPATGDGGSPALWFSGITRTGLVGGSAGMPPTTFGGTAKSNRTYASQNYTSLSRYRITNVTGELGGTLTVDYSAPDCQGGAPTPATNTTLCYPVYWSPGSTPNPVLDWFNKYVVTDVYSDGRTVNSVQNRTHYDYEGGGAWHFDENTLGDPAYRTWSLWRGFADVTTTTGNPGDPAGPRTVVKHRFMRGMDGDKAATGTRSVQVTNSLNESIPDSDQHAGFTREAQSLLDGNVITTTLNDPWSSAATGTDAAGLRSFLTGTATSRTRTFINATNTWRTSRKVTTHNDKGLPTELQEEGDTADPGQTTCTRTAYVANTAAWIHSYPSSVQKVSGQCANNPAGPGNIIADTRNSYDGQAFGAAPTAGKTTQVASLSAWPTGGAEAFTTTSTSYDGTYGRPVSTTDALGRVSTVAYTPATGPVTKVTKTSPPVTISNVPTPLTSSTDYDPVSGLPVTETDPAGLRTDTAYDPLGRVTATWLPGHSRAGGAPADATFAYSVSTTAPNTTTSSRLLANGQYSATYTIIDGLGRTVQTQEPTSYSAGGRLVTDQFYDSQGRDWKKHDSYWNSAAPQGTLLVVQDSAVPRTTVNTYDSANRATRSAFQRNGQFQWETLTTYGGDRVTTIPPLGGTATATVNNGTGQRTKVLLFHNRLNTGPTDPADTTTFTYDRAGALATVTDATGQNTWSFTTDLRGYKVAQTDPDTGSSTYTYDNAGQLTSSTDARGKTIAYTYDNLGRKTASYDTNTSGTKLTQFVYDTLLKGKQTSAVRFSGGKAYVVAAAGYDAAGRSTGSKITIPSGETGLSGTYTFGVEYDPLTGAVTKESSPGIGGLPAETQFRSYNALGKPTDLYAANGGGGTGTHLVSLTEYNAFGQPLRVNLADQNDPNQVSTTWTYDDATGRLASSATVRATTTDQWVTNRGYTYTPSGSLTKITDVNDTQCFGYDHLQRLNRAWTPASGDCLAAPTTAGLGGAAPFWTDWTHDATGNRLTETDHTSAGDTTSTLTYPAAGAAKPHAVTSATTTGPGGTTTDSYTYDATGNTLTRAKGGTTHTFTYDAEGHVATATDNTGKQSSYLYDAAGNRLITRDHTGTTLAVGDTELFVAAGTTTASGTRFYAHGGTQVAVRTTAGLTWKVLDHHGTSTATVKASNLAVTRRYQDPYGNTRGTAPSSWSDKHTFIGGYQDTTTLVHVGAREYDPTIGRFTSVDPILDPDNPQSWNGYAYANNNPVDHADPTGLFCDSCEFLAGKPMSAWGCLLCSATAPPPSAPKSQGNTSTVSKCDSCNGGKGWASGHGGYPAKVGNNGKLALDVTKLATPPKLQDLRQHFYNDLGEWYPLVDHDYALDPLPGYEPPEELSNGTRWLIFGGVVAGTICAIAEPCGAIALGLIEATGPPVVVAPGGLVATAKGIHIVDEAISAGTKAETNAAKGANAASRAEGTAAGAEDMVSIYRTVDGREFDAIADAGNKFTLGAGQMEGKWFALSGKDADKWGQVMNGDDALTIETKIPRKLFDELHHETGNLDGIGPGVYADQGMLERINQYSQNVRIFGS